MLWSRVEALEASIRTWSLRVWNLQRVLSKKRDPVSHVCFAELVYSAPGRRRAGPSSAREQGGPQVETVFEGFWHRMTGALHGEIEKAARAYPFVRSVLGVQDYPKLRALFRTLPARLAQRTAGKSVAGIGNTNEEVQAILRALQPLLEVFLAQSHHRLKETVEVMFPRKDGDSGFKAKQSALPTRSDLFTFAKTVSQELAAARGDPDLGTVIARGAGNAISLFANKAQEIVETGEGAAGFSAHRGHDANGRGTGQGTNKASKSNAASSAAPDGNTQTPVQAHNVAVLSLALRLLGYVREMPEKTTSSNAERRDTVVRNKAVALRDAEERLLAVAQAILGDYLAAAARYLASEIARIHLENFNHTSDLPGQDGMADSSPFMSAFSAAVQSVRVHHLNSLPKGDPTVVACCDQLQARVLSLFARHVVLVRPVNALGRMRLANELAQFELSVEPLALSENTKLARLGGPYTELRALRQLLFVEAPSDADQATSVEALASQIRGLGHSLRASTIWLSVFADAPPELRSPSDFVSVPRGSSPEQAYCDQVDAVEQSLSSETVQRGSPSGLAAGPGDGLAYLQVGTKLAESPVVKTHVLGQVSAALDKYMQLLSGASQGADAYCLQYHLLRALEDL